MDRLHRIAIASFVGLVGFAVLRRIARGAARRAQRSGEGRVIEMPIVRIYGTVPKDVVVPDAHQDVTSTPTLPRLDITHPLHVSFSLRVSEIEKWAVSGADVRDAVLAKARQGAMFGTGNPVVIVRESRTGYDVSVTYPNSPESVRAVSTSSVKSAIEAVDPRLQGRVSNVKVVRD